MASPYRPDADRPLPPAPDHGGIVSSYPHAAIRPDVELPEDPDPIKQHRNSDHASPSGPVADRQEFTACGVTVIVSRDGGGNPVVIVLTGDDAGAACEHWPDEQPRCSVLLNDADLYDGADAPPPNPSIIGA